MRVLQRPDDAETWNNRAVALFASRTRLPESASSYYRALDLRPKFVQAFGGLMYTKTYTCDWRDRAADLATLTEFLTNWLAGTGPPVLLPLQALVYPLHPPLMRVIASHHASRVKQERLAAATSARLNRLDSRAATAVPAPPAEQAGRGILRLCYASLGFESHPHGQLTRGLFASHNRVRQPFAQHF